MLAMCTSSLATGVVMRFLHNHENASLIYATSYICPQNAAR